MSIYDDSRFPVALEKYNVKTLSGEFSEVAHAMGAYTKKITAPNDIIPAIKRGIAETEAGKTVVLEFITKDEGEEFGFTFVGRGFEVKPGISLNQTLDRGLQKVAEKVIVACPTGALAENEKYQP